MAGRHSTSGKVRVGVIGAGLWGSAHMKCYAGLPHVELAAVADCSAEKASQAASDYGIPRWFEDYRQLCAIPDLDAVSVVTPEAHHLGPVLAAAESGKHILVEKPIASDVADVEAMIAAARRADVILMPAHILRFETRYAMVKDKIESGELGNIVTIQARRNRTKETRRKYARAHPVFAAAIHDIDVLLWYVGAKVKRVRAYHRNIMKGITPDVMWGILEFDNGVLGSIECTWLTPDAAGIPSDDLLHVITDKGVATIDFVHTGLALWKESGFEAPDVSIAPELRGRLEGALAAELSQFTACVLNGEKPRVITAEEALESIRVAAALVESAEKNEDVILDAHARMRSQTIL